eukprot:TRINITY_DN41394_c0_g1_i1.p2 TRINITY_DN41394_c0_g1~~TRINITY_DN41394_c0_g1_i1.p2  ORF type:complete len:118 (+),score=16.19 TRINITY_DN41394_c0_g1_i1:54-407(+)
MTGGRTAAFLVLAAFAEAQAPLPVPAGAGAPDLRPLEQRITQKITNVYTDDTLPGFSWKAEYVIGLICACLVGLCFLLTLCYACATGGKGKFARPIAIAYRPAQFIEAERQNKLTTN